MHYRRNPVAHVVKLALALAETGKFEDSASIQRELIDAGCAVEEVLVLDGLGLRILIDSACASRREREEPTWH
jgi:hypothetical protein